VAWQGGQPGARGCGKIPRLPRSRQSSTAVSAAAAAAATAAVEQAAADTAIAVTAMAAAEADASAAAGSWAMVVAAADQGNAAAQFYVGEMYVSGEVGVKKDLPLGKRYLELSAAQGNEEAVVLLKELRKCVACGKLDVHHKICSRCYNRRFCDATCQLRHWNSAVDPHKHNCVKRRQAVGAGRSSSEHADPSPDNN